MWITTLVSLLVVYGKLCCGTYRSTLFRDANQASFVSSLTEYLITKPLFSLSKHVRIQRITWKTLNRIQPEKFYLKLKINQMNVKLVLRRNKNLLRQDFTMESVNETNRVTHGKSTDNYLEKNKCYYSGYVRRHVHSRVALSICDGLKGFISFKGGNYLIEPMKQVGSNFFHLVYESRAELNSTHNPLKGSSLKCPTGHYYGDSRISATHISAFLPPPEQEVVPNRQKRDTNNNDVMISMKQLPVATLEVFVVVDKYMVAFHGNHSVQDYVLTMMNMVADMYKDKSLGVLVNIVVTKVLIINEDLKNLHISHNGDKTLFSFCEWQFIRSLSEERENPEPSYDLALLLTRKDVCAHSDSPCGTIGLAYIGGTCTTNRKCAVVEDIGLNTAYTIAHELGHNLGMTHDGLDNDCKMESAGYPHMMAAQWPNSNHVPLKWSYCSKRKLGEFLGSYKSYCIRDKSLLEDSKLSKFSELSGILPGKLYDADTQCRQQYGAVAKHCAKFKTTGLHTDTCKQLWCEIEEEEDCVSKLDPAAKGTKCDEGKWCMYGECVNNTSIPRSIDGGWSAWQNWTSCSRSCGVGVSYMERHCNNPLPSNGGHYCIGESRKYVTCNIETCPNNSVSIRLLQCQQYNNNTLKYINVHSETQQCALHCRPSGNTAHYSVNFQQKVIDGTPCRQGSSDICIDGRCESLGCDLKLNSKMQKDICGVCGGNGNTCNLIEGEFTQPLGRGYVNAVDIPRGARNVLVKEVKPCASFLALKSGHGMYHVNGNWTIELPGTYNVNGTVVYYRRRGTQEFFFTEGPTKEEMHFMVLFQDFNFGIKYRYVLPLIINETDVEDEIDIKRKKYKGTFGWMQGNWKKCSVVCGGGIMRRSKARCLHMYQRNVSIVDDHLCSGAKMPPSLEKTCNEHKCPKVWFVTPWSACSKTCGLGRKKRRILCKARKSDGSWQSRPITECPLSERPVSINTCVEKACYLSWRKSAWSKCRGKCGSIGLKYRSVTCPLRNTCSRSLKPSMTRRCKLFKCYYQWIAEPWSQCSKSCGEGVQERSVKCREMGSFKVSTNKCLKENPKQNRTCYIKDCQDISSTITNKSKVVLNNNEKWKFMIPNKVILNIPRAPRKKRKPSSSPFKNLFNLLKKKSAPVQSALNCKKNILAPWFCKLKIRLSRYANQKAFCDDPVGSMKCCETCRSQNSVSIKESVPKKEEEKTYTFLTKK